MPSANRKALVDPTEVGIYHCASYCVRRGNVQGKDTVSGLDRTHRCRWIQKRLADLAGVFAVEVLDYGLIDNGLHSVLQIRPDVTVKWSDDEVIRRWCRLNRRRLQLKEEPLSRKRLNKLLEDSERVAEWRKRLSDLSWFMIMVKEPIAREANREDGVAGHFFGERFWCRRCWTKEEVTQAMMFAHTNPVRAGLAETPESAEYSSLRDRLEDQRVEESSADVGGILDDPRVGSSFERAGDDSERAPGPRDARSEAERRAGFLARLRLEGGGVDTAGEGRRLTNDVYLDITLSDYRKVIAACRNDGDGEGEEWGRWRESIPAELPVELERLGFDRVRWAESYRRNARRFDRLTRRSDQLRRDFHQRL